ncbi:MAG: PASTA domain-containing protein [Chitinophagaceae bacterium]|nr:MAG: PASTA domain-containing protein [Chitinophagaceae bacterium]
MFKFITHRSLWVNILVGLLLAVGMFATIIFSLNWFTGHGDAKTVPSVVNKPLAEAQKILEGAGFTVEVQDSVYYDTLKPLQIVRQIPDAEEIVKSHRTIYLTVNRAVPPMVKMPNIVGYSLRSAQFSLENARLKMGDTILKPDFAKNSILEQLYNGQNIQPGALVRQGSKIDLVVGNGLSNQYLTVPDLIGMTYSEAKALLDSKGIGLGAVIANANVTDTLSSFIFRQSPPKFDDEGNIRSIRPGQLIDIWLSLTAPEKKVEQKEDSTVTNN